MKVLKAYRFDEVTVGIIDELRVNLNLANNSDVLRRAITLLKLASENQQKGGSIVLKLKKSEKEIVLN